MKTTDIFLEIKADPPKGRAILVTDKDSNCAMDFVWLPKSQIEYEDGMSTGDACVITMPEWLAKEKGFI